MYGAVRTRTGTSGNEFTYTGEQVDATGLQYLRARYYHAATGRFAHRDPLLLIEPPGQAGHAPFTHRGTPDAAPYRVVSFRHDGS